VSNGLASVRKLIEAEFGKIRQHQEPAELLIVAAEESFETKGNALYGQAVQALQAVFPAAVPKIRQPKHLASKSAASAAVSHHKHHGRYFVQAPRETYGVLIAQSLKEHAPRETKAESRFDMDEW
jgi:hypothetical protein